MRKLLVLAVLVAFAVVLAGCEGSDPPASAGYFSTLPAGSALPSPSDCAARVHRSSWEPRPTNQRWAVDDPYHVDAWGGVTQTWNYYAGRVTGTMRDVFPDDGTPPETDEVIQFFACKWGLSDNWVRAEAISESNWHQRDGDQQGEGDWTTNFSWCAPGAPTRNGGTECAQSLGMLQIKTRFRDASIYPAIWDSLIAHMDYFGWEMRGCIEGQKYVGSGNPGGLSTANDLPDCIGNWFSGTWPNANGGGGSYYAGVKAHYDGRDWLGSGF